jgi:hypothetical protein
MDRRTFVPYAICVVLLLLVFGKTLSFGFVLYDDPINITKNRYLHPISPSNILRFWVAPYERLYIPVTYMFWAIEGRVAQQPDSSNRLLGGFDPRIFHFGNVALHILATCILFTILRRLVGYSVPALAGALLFGLHPLQVESVAWVTETKERPRNNFRVWDQSRLTQGAV